MAKYTPKPYVRGRAQDDPYVPEDNPERYNAPRARRRSEHPQYTWDGERIPPIAGPFKRSGCVWVRGIGWVWNPSGRRFVA